MQLHNDPRPSARPLPLALVAVSLLAALFALLGGFHEAALAAGPARLGTAGNFAVVASSTITNTGLTTITGDVGLSPGSSVTGFAPCTPPAPADCVALTGALHVADGVALQAKADALDAYNDLVQLESTCTELVDVELAGATFTPGVYCSPGTFNLSAGGTLTLDAQGDPDAEFIFLTGAGGTTLITGADSQVLLIGEAQPCNVYWQVGSSATIGVGTDFVGNILAEDSIQLQTGATLEGRALALNGAVTLDTNTITKADCEGSPPTTTPTTTPTTGTPTTGTPTTGTPTTGTPTTGTPTTGTPTTTRGAIRITGSGTTGGGSSTSTARTTKRLARTGADITTPLAFGLLALILGTEMLVASRLANTLPRRRLRRR